MIAELELKRGSVEGRRRMGEAARRGSTTHGMGVNYNTLSTRLNKLKWPVARVLGSRVR